MKNARFYIEFPSPAGKKMAGKNNIGHRGFVICVMWNTARKYTLADDSTDTFYSGIIPYGQGINPICGPTYGLGIAEKGYLKKYCKRISEATARKIHPKLFAYID